MNVADGNSILSDNRLEYSESSADSNAGGGGGVVSRSVDGIVSAEEEVDLRISIIQLCCKTASSICTCQVAQNIRMLSSL